MKKLIVLLFAASLAACQSAPRDEALRTYNPAVPHGQISFFGSVAQKFYGGSGPEFNGLTTVESSLLNVDGRIFSIHDPTYGRDLYLSDLGTSGREFNSLVRVSSGRFPYVVAASDGYYLFHTLPTGIFVSKSVDLMNWTPANNGLPVLTPSSDPSSIYNQIWNVGIAIDDHGIWHLLVECSDSTPDQLHVGLGYSSARWENGRLNFDPNRTTQFVVPFGGNPHLSFVPGKGLLAIHGQVFDPVYGMNSWYLTASTLNLGDTTWRTHKSSFAIGTPDDRIAHPDTAAADPTMIERADGTTEIMFSYAQDSIYRIESNLSIAELYDELEAP